MRLWLGTRTWRNRRRRASRRGSAAKGLLSRFMMPLPLLVRGARQSKMSVRVRSAAAPFALAHDISNAFGRASVTVMSTRLQTATSSSTQGARDWSGLEPRSGQVSAWQRICRAAAVDVTTKAVPPAALPAASGLPAVRSRLLLSAKAKVQRSRAGTGPEPLVCCDAQSQLMVVLRARLLACATATAAPSRCPSHSCPFFL